MKATITTIQALQATLITTKDFNSVMLANMAGQMEDPKEAAKYTEEALKKHCQKDTSLKYITT